MTPCLIDLSTRAKFRLTGADRERYLNGQVSNQVSRATAEAAVEACVCNVKGKLDGVIHITRSDDGGAFWIDAPAELRESLFARLSRYIIADDCELEDVTEEWGLIHALGDGPGVPGARGRASDRYGVPGRDFWLEPSAVPPAEAEAEAEDLRIRHGVPRWGAELTPDTLPAEAGLDRRAVDFHKGCYLGQEVVSRLESVGRVNRVLALLWSGQGGGRVGAEVLAVPAAEGDKALGVVTSVSPDGCHALAYVKRDRSAPETKLVFRGRDGKVESQIWEVRTFQSAET
jgi:folate-binding protein YgfZ